MNKINIFTLMLLCTLTSACNFENFDERCEREAKEFTEKQCPRRMDKCTIMDSISYDNKTKTIIYYYTLEGELDNDSIFNEEVYSTFKELLLKQLVNSVDLKTYKEKEINFKYVYKSKSTKKNRIEELFTPNDYK